MNKNDSQVLLHQILDRLTFRINPKDAHRFYTRLGLNFHTVHSIFHELYSERDDFLESLTRLIKILGKAYSKRSETLKIKDMDREINTDWFLSQKWVGMALYANRFADNIKGVTDKIDYFNDLGINLVHLMPVMKCPKGASDGGYAVSDFKKVDSKMGDLDQLIDLGEKLNQNDILLTLDVVLNHTSNEHIWAKKAIKGDEQYENYYYTFDTKEETALYEQTMPEIFPETSPGSFTFNNKMNKWVMTVFHDYQWDLNYANPNVLIEMIDIILYYANLGADILRLDAVAFLWKKIGTTCQNLREAHLILQLIRACSQIVTPGVIFIAEAIVAPDELIKYFGCGAENMPVNSVGNYGGISNKECDIAYNATLMALLWDGVATKNAELLNYGINSLPRKPETGTWLNYLRCHDDIGLGFSDRDIILAGYNVKAHRKFLLNYFTGGKEFSDANGLTFGENVKTGDARIAGTLASLVGLGGNKKLQTVRDEDLQILSNEDIKLRTDQIIMLHSLIFAFEGIPLLYYGDEIGTVNDFDYLNDKHMSYDSRWAHRPVIDWEKAKLRKKKGTIEQKIFSALKKLISLRKSLAVFKDNNSHISPVYTGNKHILCWIRSIPDSFVDSSLNFMKPAPDISNTSFNDKVLVIANLAVTRQYVTLSLLSTVFNLNMHYGEVKDLYSGKNPKIVDGHIVFEPFSFMWLTQVTL